MPILRQTPGENNSLLSWSRLGGFRKKKCQALVFTVFSSVLTGQAQADTILVINVYVRFPVFPAFYISR